MLTDLRRSYLPLEYPQAETYWDLQQQSHWLRKESNMGGDLLDWNTRLTEQEKNVVGRILKGFTQGETIIAEYWSGQVAQWFPKPEIKDMALTFGCWETIHGKAYRYLLESLGLSEFDVFTEDPEAAAKLNYMINTPSESIADKALSLAVFSGFAEGVNLFSSFAVLQSFSMRNLMKGVAKVVEWSSRDEELHSDAGCWLYRVLCSEVSGLKDKLQSKIYEASDAIIQLEHSFLEQVFQSGDLKHIQKDSVKAYIIYRTNLKLGQLGYEPIHSLDLAKAEEIESWFSFLNRTPRQTDFFAAMESSYTKGSVDFSDLDWSTL